MEAKEGRETSYAAEQGGETRTAQREGCRHGGEGKRRESCRHGGKGHMKESCRHRGEGHGREGCRHGGEGKRRESCRHGGKAAMTYCRSDPDKGPIGQMKKDLLRAWVRAHPDLVTDSPQIGMRRVGGGPASVEGYGIEGVQVPHTVASPCNGESWFAVQSLPSRKLSVGLGWSVLGIGKVFRLVSQWK
ncbi:hypothetical protein XELAEV_18031494mg [Xenopus laevis]|uniref:Uncharacterized protein n=1 Tax=Xenopus laevis TaxID=8355 RepID=A0A974HFQ7_XENLA|nr:hypothetical protein XELAEV_18031494mg [Xenopus laevis]